jgi:hypothetical protein
LGRSDGKPSAWGWWDSLRSAHPAVYLALILVALIPPLAGCGRGDQDETAPAEGRVLIDGEPLSSGTVVFFPEQGRQAKGKIGSDGRFTMGTYGRYDGAVLGHHQVAIIAPDPEALAAAGDRLIEIPSLVPEHYTAPASSGLTAEVTRDGENHFEFRLTTDDAGQ